MLDFLGHYAIEQFPFDYPACDTGYRDIIQAAQKAHPVR